MNWNAQAWIHALRHSQLDVQSKKLDFSQFIQSLEHLVFVRQSSYWLQSLSRTILGVWLRYTCINLIVYLLKSNSTPSSIRFTGIFSISSLRRSRVQGGGGAYSTVCKRGIAFVLCVSNIVLFSNRKNNLIRAICEKLFLNRVFESIHVLMSRTM